MSKTVSAGHQKEKINDLLVLHQLKNVRVRIEKDYVMIDRQIL